MSKPVTLFIFSLFFIGALTFGGVQYQKVNSVSKENKILTDDNSELQRFLKDANVQIEDLYIENEDLHATIAILRDSILNYEKEINSLKNSLHKRKKEIKEMQTSMDNLRNQYFALDEKIRLMEEDKQSKDAYIQQLMADRTAAQEKNDSLYMESVKIQEELTDTEEDVVALEMEKMKQEELLNILEFTNINFNKFTIKKSEVGPDQKKIKKEGRAWNYTYINLDFVHENIQQLIDERFVLKLVDIDNKKELSFVESNPAFPDSQIDHKGIQFQYTGEAAQLVFHNNEIKTGENYAVQLYYLKDGKEHLLRNGYQQFIVQGKLLKQFPVLE